MNMAFLLAGTTSTNPVLVILGFLLILAWKNAGYIGLDYFLLPMLGTPWWKPGKAPAVLPRGGTPVGATRRNPPVPPPHTPAACCFGGVPREGRSANH